MYSGRIKKTALARRVAKTCQRQLTGGKRASFEANNIEILKKRLMIDVRERYRMDGGVGPRNGGDGIHRLLILSTFRWDHYF